ncbi:hypothetical protein E4V42_07335 [Clostridium estertheticum]|uniref:Uncharacterized protein n=1 Tax=Clostridium estertheticum TaxID=238834 RepID=A0A5N7IZP3_9CLOT|nr:hypothetical protein [Clostridium estertheticum]MPQ31248.1 hypothetical protein [Clostridium estertheticum]MPQ61922.1 hypothetical protein [Clostridium estertheticum]
MLNEFMRNEIDMDFHIKGEFNTVFDLSYTLIDLQAIVSGFLYVSGFDEPIYGEEQDYLVADVGEKRREKVADEIIYKIENKFPEINEQSKEELKKEIDNSFSNTFDNNLKVASKRKGYISTTSRSFARKYKESLKLKSFKSGSITLAITSTVFGGLLLEFIKRLVFKETKSNEVININFNNSTVNIDKNNIIFSENKSLGRYLKIDDNLSNEYININSKEYIDDIISKVTYEENDYEKNVMNFLQVLQEEGVIGKQVMYNKNGVQTVVRDIKRFTGRFIDTSI